MNFNVTFSTKTGGDWLSVPPSSGSTTATQPALLFVSIDPSGTGPGTRFGDISISSPTSGETAVIPVVMAISERQRLLRLSRKGMTFTAVSGGSGALPQRLRVANSGVGTLNWSISTTTLSGGPDWLTVAPAMGSTEPNGQSAVEVRVQPGSLPPGRYYGSIRTDSSGAASVLSDKGLALKSQGVASWDMARPIAVLQLTPEDRSELQRRVRAPTTSQRDGLRARIVLLRGEGLKQKDVAEKLATSVTTVSLWSQRFGRDGFEGLRDKPGRGRKPWLPVEKIQKVITQVTQPPKGRRRWSVRTMAKAVGISHDSVHRIWRQNDLKPHLRRTFKLSQDPEFERKFWDVIGLYLNPPDKALVLCCDEKSQCQALERTQPGLPLGIGHIRTRTHDYIRHGTITLFAALNYLDGKILSRTEARHTHVEWLRFLKQIERETPQDLDLHLIIDNYATHKHAAVKQWLDKHSRFHIHFTPTSSSWLNLVERFFADLTEECVREGSFRGVRQLIKAIEEYMAARNDEPKRYVWRAEGQQILAKIQRARAALAQAVK